MIVPAGYLYLRTRVHQQPFRKKDFIHILPCLVYTLFFVLPYFTGKYYSFLNPGVFNSSAGRITDTTPAILFAAYGFCVVGVYIVLVIKFLVERYHSFSQAAQIHTISPGLIISNEMVMPTSQPSEVQVGSIHFTGEQLANMDQTLRDLLMLKQPFLQHGYTLKQLSDDTGILLHHLSAFINQYYHIHFNDLINEYRVQYCQAKIRNEEWKYKTLEAIADESGFSNRNTFTAAFKKVTGCNPSDYLKLVKQQQQKTA
jgi:AraC-like DNA-binding protein